MGAPAAPSIPTRSSSGPRSNALLNGAARSKHSSQPRTRNVRWRCRPPCSGRMGACSPMPYRFALRVQDPRKVASTPPTLDPRSLRKKEKIVVYERRNTYRLDCVLSMEAGRSPSVGNLERTPGDKVESAGYCRNSGSSSYCRILLFAQTEVMAPAGEERALGSGRLWFICRHSKPFQDGMNTPVKTSRGPMATSSKVHGQYNLALRNRAAGPLAQH